MEDKEIQAIAAVNAALKDLSDDERFRVIQWVANKYVQTTSPLKVASPPSAAQPAGLHEGESGSEEEHDQLTSYDTFAEMLDASGASKEGEFFVIAAYWLQVVKGEETWKSYEVNKLLKDTGNQIDRISNPIRALSNTKPRVLVQISKNATSAGKGSKVFKLTTEGVKRAERMLGKAE